MKISEAIASGDSALTEKLVKQALQKFSTEMMAEVDRRAGNGVCQLEI